MRRLALLAILIALLTVQAVLAQDATATPDQATLLADCNKMLAPDRPMPTGPDAPSIKLVAPTDPVVYGSTVTFQVQTTNFDINANGDHWHLWMNGQLTGMVYQPTAIIDMNPGTYEVCATLGDANHVDIGTPAVMFLTVKPAVAGVATATLPVARSAAQVQPDTGVGPAQIAVIVVGGLAAAIGGWWFGKRMPKNIKQP